MTPNPETSKCPFHRTLRVLSTQEGGGLNYRAALAAVLEYVQKEALGVLLVVAGEHPSQQRALGSYVSSQLFWERFERATLNQESLRLKVQNGEDPYHAALASTSDHIQELLKPKDLIEDARSELHKRVVHELIELLKAHSKGDRAKTPEEQIHVELMGALKVIADFCALVENLHLRDYEGAISMEEFTRTVSSAEFHANWLSLAENSQAVAGQLVFEDLIVDGKVDPTRFELEKREAAEGTYFIVLDRRPDSRSEPIRKILEGEEPNPTPRVRCPALELFGTAPISGTRTNLVKVMSEWFVLNAIIPAVEESRKHSGLVPLRPVQFYRFLP